MPQDKGHDDTFPVVFIPPVQSVDNGQQREVSVGDPTMPIVQGTNNEQQGSVDITTRTISTIQPIDNANENAITSPIVFANTIQPTDNFPEDDITLPIVELKETNSPEDEQDISINSPIIIVPPVQPIDNDKGIDINTPSVISEPIKPIDNDAKKHKVLPLRGKLITSEDPVTIGANFKTYKNLRPTATHPRAIGGMSKVNSANVMDATYLKTRSAYHLIKDQPAESHVLVQAYNAALTASQILDNATAIGTVGDFAATELWTDTGTVEYGKWSEATEGQVVYCNGTDTCIWGGNELRCPVFITSTATIPDTGDIANPKDFTSMINNTRQDVASVVALGGGVDSSTKLLIHANEADATAGTDIIDSSLTPKTITAVGNAQVDTDQAKFGTGSVKFDGTGDYLTLVDSADWYFAAAPFTIETWIKLSALDTYGICGQWDDANNYWYVGTGVSGYVKFVIKSGGAVKADYITQYAPLDGLWHHLAVVRNTTSVYIFVDGVSIPLTVNTAISTNEIPDLASTLYIGIMGAASAVEWPIYGWMDEFRISKGIARWTAGFTVPARAYSSSTSNWLIGSLRPLKGVKYYISSGNTTASVMTGKQWIGTTWETLALTDNTDTGASLAITGTVTFASTVTTARPRYISGYFLYWYQFSIDAGEATIYYVTLDAPFQRIVDIWDGVERNIGLCYLYKRDTIHNRGM